MFKKYNPNPSQQRNGDCIIRAITKVTGRSWERIYLELAAQGFIMNAMPSENDVWGTYLYNMGYDRGRSYDDGLDVEELEEMMNSTSDTDIKEAMKKTIAYIKKANK